MGNPCQPRTSVYGGGFLNTRELGFRGCVSTGENGPKLPINP
jgi:hypothetical protein